MNLHFTKRTSAMHFLLFCILITFLSLLPYFARVTAKTISPDIDHHSFSSAYTMLPGTTYQERYAANEKKYYCFVSTGSFSITIQNNNKIKGKYQVYTDTGTPLSCKVTHTQNTYRLSSVQTIKKGKRCFLSIINKNTCSASFSISLVNYYTKANTPSTRQPKQHSVKIQKNRKPSHQQQTNLQKKPIAKSKTKQTTKKKSLSARITTSHNQQSEIVIRKDKKKKKKKLSTKPDQFVKLNQHFYKLCVQKQITLSVSTKAKTIQDKDLLWASSNSSIASVKNGVITGISPGFVVISVQSSKHPFCFDTCSIRVLS